MPGYSLVLVSSATFLPLCALDTVPRHPAIIHVPACSQSATCRTVFGVCGPQVQSLRVKDSIPRSRWCTLSSGVRRSTSCDVRHPFAGRIGQVALASNL